MADRRLDRDLLERLPWPAFELRGERQGPTIAWSNSLARTLVDGREEAAIATPWLGRLAPAVRGLSDGDLHAEVDLGADAPALAGMRWPKARLFTLGRGRCATILVAPGTPAQGPLADRDLARMLFMRAGDPQLVVMPPGRTIVAANPAFERLLGHAESELLGRSTELLHPSTEEFEEFAEVGEPELDRHGVFRAEWTLLHRDGEEIPVEATVAALDPRCGWSSGVLTAVRDLRPRQEIERRLHQAQRMEAVGQLASGVAHDFNNLLTVVLGFADLLAEGGGAAGAGAAGVPEGAKEIRRAALRASHLTQQLLAFSREQVVQPRWLRLDAVLAELQPLLASLVGERVTVELAVEDEEAWPIRIDPSQLERVVINLAVNARDAMPQGGRLAIRSRCLGPGGEAEEHVDGPVVELVVEDDGMGMSEEVRAKAFEPFFTTKARGRGTGLGLATVYGIVHQAGGSVDVESEPGRGTRFVLRFPADPSKRDETFAPEPRAEAGRERVMVVEDEPAVRDLVGRALERRGYQVSAAVGPEEAVGEELQVEPPPHLLLCDIVMPVASGIQVARHLLARWPGMRVLLMSGYSASTLREHGIDPASAPLLEKPFTAERLCREVRRSLDAEPSLEWLWPEEE